MLRNVGRLDRTTSALQLMLVMLLMLCGCARVRDMGDVVDVGVTWSARPQVGVDGCLLGILRLSGGRVKAHFAGLRSGGLDTGPVAYPAAPETPT